MLGAFLCFPAVAKQMTVGDLYKICISSSGDDKTACQFYILGTFEGLQLAGGTLQNKSGEFQEAKDKHFCVPEGLSGGGMEVAVKIAMGQDLALYPEDRDLSAVTFIGVTITTQFPCQKKK